VITLIGLSDDPSLIDPAAMPPVPMPPKIPWLAYLATASAAVSGFHGYRRNKSIGWGILWFILGGLFPVIVPTIALAEGYGKPKRA
jgi:ABC-type multidrug transport system permease subunit